jgi:tetratricopeptide (TPR) repeat protein
VRESQELFKQRNYLAALEAANRAVADQPGDGALHEYRALVLFALGRYGEAAGVLNPVLASGPGWDWTTMVTLYGAQETYTDQLRKLEAFSQARPDDAAARFLLGYHYLVCGHLDRAAVQFEAAAASQPADGVSKQLAELCKASSTSGDGATDDADDSAAPAEAIHVPEVVPLGQLTGT